MFEKHFLYGIMDRIFLILLLSAGFTGVISRQTVDRIKGPGTLETEPGEFPYFANIVDRWSKELIGSGILLESRVVLTSGEDFVDKNMYGLAVYLGEYDRSNSTEESRQIFDVSKMVFHPKLNPSSGIEGDVALLQLKSEPIMNERVKPFGLRNVVKSSKEDKNTYKRSGACVVPGYGFIKWDMFKKVLPTTMRKYSPTMLPPSVCTGEYFEKLFLCSRNADLTSTCQYDGGTPLLCKNKGKTKLYGVTMGAFGYSTYCKDGQSIFTRISTFYNWIKKKTRSLQKEEIDK